MKVVPNQQHQHLAVCPDIVDGDYSSEYPPLNKVSRPSVETAAAAFYLNRAPQTLRLWACRENGPIRPRRIFGRLHWSVDEIRSLLEGE